MEATQAFTAITAPGEPVDGVVGIISRAEVRPGLITTPTSVRPRGAEDGPTAIRAVALRIGGRTIPPIAVVIKGQVLAVRVITRTGTGSADGSMSTTNGVVIGAGTSMRGVVPEEPASSLSVAVSAGDGIGDSLPSGTPQPANLLPDSSSGDRSVTGEVVSRCSSGGISLFSVHPRLKRANRTPI